jgi:hypothetical protein
MPNITTAFLFMYVWTGTLDQNLQFREVHKETTNTQRGVDYCMSEGEMKAQYFEAQGFRVMAGCCIFDNSLARCRTRGSQNSWN